MSELITIPTWQRTLYINPKSPLYEKSKNSGAGICAKNHRKNRFRRLHRRARNCYEQANNIAQCHEPLFV